MYRGGLGDRMAPWMSGLIRMENSRGGGGRGMGAQLPPPYMGMVNISLLKRQ